jgi:hypothetical protein
MVTGFEFPALPIAILVTARTSNVTRARFGSPRMMQPVPTTRHVWPVDAVTT